MVAYPDQPYFVWVKGTKGPVRQKWSQPPYGADRYWDDRILVMHPISEAMFDALTLEQLEKLFPFGESK